MEGGIIDAADFVVEATVEVGEYADDRDGELALAMQGLAARGEDEGGGSIRPIGWEALGGRGVVVGEKGMGESNDSAEIEIGGFRETLAGEASG